MWTSHRGTTGRERNIPATCGQAIEVPLMVLVASGSPSQADVIATPGAKISTQVP